jgi:tetratricopeptide (TPR) repeat protein
LGNRGAVYSDLGDIQRAIEIYNQVLKLAGTIGELNAIGIASLNLAHIYANQGDSATALIFGHEAANAFERIGHSKYAQRAQQLIVQPQGRRPAKPNSVQSAFEAFRHANLPKDLQLAIAHHPFMVNKQFIEAIEEIVNEQVPADDKPSYEQRLTWLRQIANQ